MDILIIGSGLSGAIVANHFANNGKKVLVIEKRDHIAGNIYDKKIAGATVHMYGPHIFHSDKKEVFKYMNQFWTLNDYENKVQAKIKDQQVSIPFNWKSIQAFWPQEFNEIKTKLINTYGKNTRVSVADMMSEQDSQLKEIANFIFENVFLNYTIKMWDKKPEEIDPYVMSRVPMLVTSNDEKYFQNKYEGIPKEGYTKAISNMLDHPNITIKLNTNATKLLKIKDKKVFFKNKILKIPVIYTGALDELFNYSEGVLNYRSLDIQFETLNKSDFQYNAVINYPAHPKFTRICEYKYFLNEQVEKTTISHEYPGWFKLNDKRFHTPFYPFANDQSRAQYQKYLDKVQDIDNFFLLGRLATYQYLDMDVTIANALAKLKEIESV